MSNNKIPSMKIDLDGISYDHNFGEDVKIDRTNLDHEFSTQAEKYAYYSFLAAEAHHLVDTMKSRLENVYAVVDAEKRANAAALLAAGTKAKYTETMYKNEVIGDQRYKDAQSQYHQAKKLVNQLDVASRSIAMRKDMLMQLGAAARIGAAPQRVLQAQGNHARQIIGNNVNNPTT